jgi:hypothetical protein
MQLAPFSLFFHTYLEKAMHFPGENNRTTHVIPSAGDAY